MTSFLTFRCNGDCQAADDQENMASNEVMAVTITRPGLVKTIHLCKSECEAKFMDGRLSGNDLFLQDDEDDANEQVNMAGVPA